MSEQKTIYTQRYASPYGTLRLGSWGDALCLCDWADAPALHERIARRIEQGLGATVVEASSEIIAQAQSQLDEYFARERRAFDLPLLTVGTPFQRRVWAELEQIPFGEAISYRELAQRIGSPSAVRAVAGANGVNALSILIPCHRVIGSDGTLTGYGGGLEIKRRLLELEGIHLDKP